MTVGEYIFNVRSYECGANGRLTLPSMCNYLQESASAHAGELGFSKHDLDTGGRNISWALSRLVVKMACYPSWNDTVSVITFPRGGRRIVAWRDFLLKASDGSVIGLASSEWMTVDLAARKITPIPNGVLDCRVPGMEPVLGSEPFSPRLKYPGRETSAPLTFTAQHSHIDMNGHVNNVHYIEWLLEPFSGDANLSEMEISFRNEVMAGDTVMVETCESPEALYHRIRSPDGVEYAIARTVR